MCTFAIIHFLRHLTIFKYQKIQAAITNTTMNLRIAKIFQLKSKINYRKFREHARKLHRSSNLWPAKYPKKSELNQFSCSSIELIHKSLEVSCFNKKEFPYSVETQKLIKLRRKSRRAQIFSWRSLYLFKNGDKLSTERRS